MRTEENADSIRKLKYDTYIDTNNCSREDMWYSNRCTDYVKQLAKTEYIWYTNGGSKSQYWYAKGVEADKKLLISTTGTMRIKGRTTKKKKDKHKQ